MTAFCSFFYLRLHLVQNAFHVLISKLHQLRFNLGRDPHRFSTFFGSKFNHLGAEGIALSQVVLTHIGGVDDRLGG